MVIFIIKKNVSRSVMTNWRKKYHKHETNLEFQWSKNALVAFGEFIVTYVKYIHPNGNFKNMLQTFFRSTKWCHGEMDRNAFSHENRNSRPKWKHFHTYPVSHRTSRAWFQLDDFNSAIQINCEPFFPLSTISCNCTMIVGHQADLWYARFLKEFVFVHSHLLAGT